MLVAAGCNSIFGSHDVINGSTDADVRPKDAAPYTMYLTALTVDTTNAPAMTPDVAPTTPAVAATA